MNYSMGSWERLYRDESPRLWRALVAYSGDPDVAGDAIAEAFAQAISRGDEIKAPAPWIWTASFRIAAGELKRRAGHSEFKDHETSYELADPLLPQLMEALRQLTPNQRAAVVLHDYADRPTAEITEVLGMKLPTVHVHLSQGRKRLRELLEGTHDRSTE